MLEDQIVFILMVAAAVFLMVIAFTVPNFGTDAQAAKNMRGRIKEVLTGLDGNAVSLLREKYLHNLSPMERQLESLPGMERLSRFIEQAGRDIPAYRLVMFSAVIALISGAIISFWLPNPWLVILVGLLISALPFLKIVQERNQRLSRFEEQLPEALDVMSRAMRAGHPFTETLKLVGEEMDDPIGTEFRITFTDINFGMSVNNAFLHLLQRVPSMSLMTLVTAVLVQRETGGNLAEILNKISAVLRSRFCFHRKVKTLSAEGRMSAWILSLIPFALTLMLTIVQPDYIPMLIEDEFGRQLIMYAFGAIVIGIFWIRKIIKIDV